MISSSILTQHSLIIIIIQSRNYFTSAGHLPTQPSSTHIPSFTPELSLNGRSRASAYKMAMTFMKTIITTVLLITSFLGVTHASPTTTNGCQKLDYKTFMARLNANPPTLGPRGFYANSPNNNNGGCIYTEANQPDFAREYPQLVKSYYDTRRQMSDGVGDQQVSTSKNPPKEPASLLKGNKLAKCGELCFMAGGGAPTGPIARCEEPCHCKYSYQTCRGMPHYCIAINTCQR